jgi:hypothetical protein
MVRFLAPDMVRQSHARAVPGGVGKMLITPQQHMRERWERYSGGKAEREAV